LELPEGFPAEHIEDFTRKLKKRAEPLTFTELLTMRAAREAGVPVSTLWDWEADRGLPGLPALLRLAQALGVPPERFAEGVEDPAGDEPEPGRQ
jgi:transcriptional regulator with XRE-family HTH domain